MRVLVANHTPVYGSGTGTYILTIATGLARRGHDVAVLTPPSCVAASVPPGIAHFEANGLGDDFPSFTGHPCSSRRYRLADDDVADITEAWTRSLAEVVRSWDPTVVHTQHLWLLTTAALAFDRTVVTTCHGSEIPLLDGELERFRRFDDTRSPAAVISVSEFVHRSAERHLIADAPHVTMLGPYDPERFSHRPRNEQGRRPRIGLAARLVPYKRVDRFLEITRRVVDLVPDVEAWIIGDGDERPALEALATSLGLGDHVRFLGFQDHTAMPTIYRELDALVMCSPHEPFGLAAVEAAGCGTAAFIPTDGGSSELESRPHIRGYSWESTAAVSAEIASLLITPENESQRSARSQYVVERYSADAYVGQLERIYSEAIESGR